MPYLWLLISCLMSPLALAAEHPHEHDHAQHQAHVHGEAELMLAIDGQTLELVLISPAMNIVGFEHAPSTAEQVVTVRQAVDRLHQADSLFQLPVPAGCRLLDVEVETGLMPTADHPVPDDGAHEVHAEFHAHYRYQCDAPEALNAINLNLFEVFPGLQRIHAQAVSGHGQHQAELDRNHTRLPL